MARLTDSEWKVMEALWQGGPQTLGEVLARLAEDTGWSRTTVHTYLTRMMAKGLVAADAQSPRRYSAARSRESCVAEEERSLADRAYRSLFTGQHAPISPMRQSSAADWGRTAPGTRSHAP